MDGDSWGDIFLLIIFLLSAAYFASSEISFASLDTFRAKSLADKGDKKAKKALFIVDNFDKALTTILIGNNVTHIGFSAVATAMATDLWGVRAVPVVTLVTTVVVFFFSEMLPKSYANGAFSYAMRVAPSLKGLMTIFTPLSFFFTKISNFIGRVLKTEKAPEITEDEFYTIVETVKEEGVIEDEKMTLLNSSIAFDKLVVQEAYQPIENLDSIDINASDKEIFEQVKASSFSRLPVYENSKDNIIGVLRAKYFLKDYILNQKVDVRSIMIKPTIAEFSMPVDNLLRKMSNERNHIAIVKDDEKRIRGIITLEDIIEELVGEIWDENDEKFILAYKSMKGGNK